LSNQKDASSVEQKIVENYKISSNYITNEEVERFIAQIKLIRGFKLNAEVEPKYRIGEIPVHDEQ
jgi:hypothetical protein